MAACNLLVPIAAALALTACATPGGIEVTRFHLGQPLPHASVAVVAVDPAAASSLAFRSYADAVAAELARVGFERAVAPGSATYIAALGVTQTTQAVRRAPPVRIGFGVGVGGGGYHGGGGVGAGVSTPVGQGRVEATRVNTLSLKLKRRTDEALLWEGTASAAADARDAGSALTAAVPVLAHALLAEFPGRSGVTARYPLPRR